MSYLLQQVISFPPAFLSDNISREAAKVQGAGQTDGNPLDLWRKKLHSNPMSEVAEFFAWVILVQESNRSFTCHLGSSA